MNFQLKYSARASYFINRTHKTPHRVIAETCRVAGLSGLECDESIFVRESDLELTEISQIYKSQGIRFSTFHLPYAPDYDLASFYESSRVRAVELIKLWLHKALILGAEVLIFHPTTSVVDADIEGLEVFIKQLGKSLDELLPIAEAHGLTLALENMLPTFECPGRFGGKVEHIQAIASAFHHSHLGFCYDTGHAQVANRDRAVELLEVMAPRLVALHLQDNAGDKDSHMAPGRGRVDWQRVFGIVSKINFARFATIEAPPFAYGPVYSQSAWSGLVKDTDTLLAKSLCNIK